jgi:hypothetical protein
MKNVLATVMSVFMFVPLAHAADDTPSYSECFKMMETALKAEVVTLQAEVDAMDNPQNVPATVPNAANDAAAKQILNSVNLHIDPANPTATPEVELNNYPLDEDADEEATAEDDTPPVVTPKELCKALYGIAIQ